MSDEALRPGDIQKKSTKRPRYWQENSRKVILDIAKVAENAPTFSMTGVMDVRNFHSCDLV